ncbi:MAG: conjugal transfer protein TraH [Alphaproteobacteria bacterium]|nr:conjugal transfer protein TraH [Alphaproteobacteria bacterium]
MKKIMALLTFQKRLRIAAQHGAIAQKLWQQQDFSYAQSNAKNKDRFALHKEQGFGRWCLVPWQERLTNQLGPQEYQSAWGHFVGYLKSTLAFLSLKTKNALITLIIAQGANLYAPIAQDLMAFFKSAGMASNVTAPGAYRDQSAGYYTGGSIMARTGSRNAQLATVQMPGFRAGCGGIDLWTGGFSHIRADAMVEMMRNIGSSAASYAFMLAVQTVSPQIYNIMNELNALATQINQTNINSCEAAATMLGGIWPQSDQASKYLCQAMGTEEKFGKFSDYAAARHGCGAKGDRGGILNKINQDPRFKDMLVGEFNLAWKAIQTNAFLSTDQELAQLFLTLVGSIIARQSEESFEILTLPGHADRDDVLNGLLNGGNTPIYRCDDGKCLRPVMQHINLPESHALFKKTHFILESLIEKIYADTEPTAEEKDFLNSTRLPVYKMLNVSTAFRKGYAPIDVHQYAELIALDILYKYVIEVIDIVHDSVAQLKSIQVDDAHMDRFLNQLRHARERITQKRQSAYQQMDSHLSMIQSTQVIEKQLHVMMGNVANDYNWM